MFDQNAKAPAKCSLVQIAFCCMLPIPSKSQLCSPKMPYSDLSSPVQTCLVLFSHVQSCSAKNQSFETILAVFFLSYCDFQQMQHSFNDILQILHKRTFVAHGREKLIQAQHENPKKLLFTRYMAAFIYVFLLYIP